MSLPVDQLSGGAAKPLLGKKILLTRPREQVGRFADLLREFGAEPVEVPTIQIAPPLSWEALDGAIATLRSYDWLVFTSVNGVHAFFTRFEQQQRALTELSGLKLCAIGPATARPLHERGLRVEVMPTEYRAEAVVEALAAFPLQGRRILMPRAAVARDLLPRALTSCGAEVNVVEAYRTVLPGGALPSEVQRLLDQRAIAVVTFTSSSTVTNFAMLLGGADVPRVLQDVIVACIGPITAETARSYGLTPAIVAHEYTIPGLARAIAEYFAGTEVRTRD